MSTPPKRRPQWLLPLLGLIAFLSAAVGLALFKDSLAPKRAGRGAAANGSTASVQGMPDASQVVAFNPPSDKAIPTLWVDVAQPAKVRDALFANEWAKQVLKEPLGRGFAGPWAAFLGSRGEDLQASFTGTVMNLFAEQLLSEPFRVVWFTGGGSVKGPVLLVDQPGSGAATAFAALESAAARGGYTSSTCPGGTATVGGSVTVSRWLLAEHAVYAANHLGRMVFGREPGAVLEGICSELPEMTTDGADLEIALATEYLGHEEGELAAALGLGKVARLQFVADKATLRPRGLAAQVVEPGRLDAAPLSEAMLKAIPEATSVLLTLQLKLPEQLSAKAISAYWDSGEGKVATRQVALLWNPRGDGNLPAEVAVLWSRAEDEAALKSIFNGPRRLQAKAVCGQQALTSNAEMMKKLESACAGKTPNALNAAPAVVAGLKSPASIGLGVNLGRLMPQLALDGYWSDSAVSRSTALPRTPPPEMEQAKRSLESLPFLGFSGTAQESTWTVAGFRS